jgi:mitofilin
LTTKKALNSVKGTFAHVKRITWDKFRSWSETTTKPEKPTKAEALRDHKERLKSVTANLKTTVEKGSRIGGVVRHQAEQFSEGVEELIRKAEAALADKPIKPSPPPVQVPSETVEPPPSPPPPTPTPVVESTPAVSRTKSSVPIYDVPLPIGFEPPPGYSKPVSQKLAESAPANIPAPLSLLSPTVSELSVSEPVIAQLASTIDTLASFVRSDPSASVKVHDVLESAKTDLTGLASRIERIRDEERTQLEDRLDEQAKEYTLKLLNLEMEMQDKLDSQEDTFNKFFEQEKVKFVQAYREKLNNELHTQTELINER